MIKFQERLGRSFYGWKEAGGERTDQHTSTLTTTNELLKDEDIKAVDVESFVAVISFSSNQVPVGQWENSWSVCI